MDCKDRILSNNYYDIITDFPINLQAYEYLDLCYANIDNLYNIVYISRQSVRNANHNFFDYKGVPKLYGLMQEGGDGGFDPNSLIVSGITQVQRAPLSLTGRGWSYASLIRGMVSLHCQAANSRKILALASPSGR